MSGAGYALHAANWIRSRDPSTLQNRRLLQRTKLHARPCCSSAIDAPAVMSGSGVPNPVLSSAQAHAPAADAAKAQPMMGEAVPRTFGDCVRVFTTHSSPRLISAAIVVLMSARIQSPLYLQDALGLSPAPASCRSTCFAELCRAIMICT